MKVRVVDEEGNLQDVEKLKEEKSPNYIETYATGIEGGPFGPYDFRMTFYEESLDKDENGDLVLKKILKSKVIVSYASAKQLAGWINKHLANYEEKSGHEIYVGDGTIKDAE